MLARNHIQFKINQKSITKKNTQKILVNEILKEQEHIYTQEFSFNLNLNHFNVTLEKEKKTEMRFLESIERKISDLRIQSEAERERLREFRTDDEPEPSPRPLFSPELKSKTQTDYSRARRQLSLRKLQVTEMRVRRRRWSGGRSTPPIQVDDHRDVADEATCRNHAGFSRRSLNYSILYGVWMARK